MTNYITKTYLSWKDIEADTKAMTAKILQDHDSFTGIIAITRGGMVPAAIVAEITGIKNIEIIGLSSYDGDKQGAMQMLRKPQDIGDGQGWLIIDDLSDTGNTFRHVRELYPKAILATPYVKPQGQSEPNYWVKAFAQKDWLVFPWADEG